MHVFGGRVESEGAAGDGSDGELLSEVLVVIGTGESNGVSYLPVDELMIKSK